MNPTGKVLAGLSILAMLAGMTWILVTGRPGQSGDAGQPSPATAPAHGDPVGPRIVSTVPAATLNLVLIGAADRLVGVSKYDALHLPPERRDLPVVGDYEEINYEQLVKLRPTAVIIQTAAGRISPRLRQVTEAQNIALVNLRLDRVDDIWTSVQVLGQTAGVPAQARTQIEAAQADLQAIARQYENQRRPGVVYLVSPRLMLISGAKTFIDEMIAAAGGENLGAQVGEGFVETNRETLVKLAPEVLLVGAMEEPGELENDPRLASWLSLPIPAARSGRVYLVTDGNSLMASVHIGRNVRTLAELIHRSPSRATDTVGGGSP